MVIFEKYVYIKKGFFTLYFVFVLNIRKLYVIFLLINVFEIIFYVKGIDVKEGLKF